MQPKCDVAKLPTTANKKRKYLKFGGVSNIYINRTMGRPLMHPHALVHTDFQQAKITHPRSREIDSFVV